MADVNFALPCVLRCNSQHAGCAGTHHKPSVLPFYGRYFLHKAFGFRSKGTCISAGIFKQEREKTFTSGQRN